MRSIIRGWALLREAAPASGSPARWLGIVAIHAACLVGPDAWAMGGLVLLDPPPAAGWRLATGLSFWSMRTVPGDAPRQRDWVYPALDLRGADGLFVSTDTGVGWNVSKDETTQAGFRLSPWPGRTTRQGLRIGTRLEQGVFFNRALGSVALFQSSVRHGGGRDADGWISEVGVTSGIPLPGGEPIGLSLGAGWANRRYRSSYAGDGHGVGAGWNDLQVGLSYEHRLCGHWRFDGQWLTARTAGLRQQAGGGGNANLRSVSLALWRDWR